MATALKECNYPQRGCTELRRDKGNILSLFSSYLLVFSWWFSLTQQEAWHRGNPNDTILRDQLPETEAGRVWILVENRQK